VVYGQAKYGPPRNQRRRYDATQRVKESVKNASQKKNEFLKKLQEIEKISVVSRGSKGNTKDDGLDDDLVDGMIHFTEDETYERGRGDLLHQDLELIERQLIKVHILILLKSCHTPNFQ
jgi:hypothetical protein